MKQYLDTILYKVFFFLYAGYYDVDVKQLVEPDWIRLCRQVDQDHVAELKSQFLRAPGSYFTMMVAHINLPRTSFVSTHMSEYSLEALGGNHSRVELQQILEEEPPNKCSPFQKRKVKVYKKDHRDRYIQKKSALISNSIK